MNLPESRYLAQRILACEAIAGNDSGTTESATFRVYEKLRRHLIKTGGLAVFRSLLSRALALARVEAPSLSAVQVAADGSLQGLEELAPQIGKDQASQAGAILVAQFIQLLLIFIGDSVTLHMVQHVWPEATFEGRISETEGKLEHRG